MYVDKCKQIKKITTPLNSTGSNNSKVLANLQRPVNNYTNVDQSEYIYLDLIYDNPTDDYREVEFNCNLQVPLLQRMEDYKVGVISLNGQLELPLIDEYPGLTLTVKWEQGGQQVETITVPPPQNDVFLTVYDYMYYFNEACIGLWAQYEAAYGAGWNIDPNVPTVPPGLIYDNATQILTLVADRHMTQDDAVLFPPLETILLIDTYNTRLLTGLDFIKETGNPAPFPTEYVAFFSSGYLDTNFSTISGEDVVLNRGDFPVVGLWLNFDALILVSNNLYTREHVVALNSGSRQQNKKYPILATFPITTQGEFVKIREFANPNIQFNDIMSSGPLTNISFILSSITSTGNIKPVQVSSHTAIYVKLVFAKTLFTSN